MPEAERQIAGGEVERILAFERRLAEAVSGRGEPFEHGVARFRDELPLVYWLNRLSVAPGNTAAVTELEAAADRVQGAAGLRHRKVEVDDEAGERLAPEFRKLGWTAAELVVMTHRGPLPQVTNRHKVEEAPGRGMEPFWAEGNREEREQDDEETSQLVAARRLLEGPGRARYFAARADGRIVAGCDLYSDRRTAQIEAVGTLVPYRGRGLGTAVVVAALRTAVEAGHDLVFLVADAEDWPREWYARLGFEPVWRLWDFLRTPAPLYALRLRTPRLELRLPTDDELIELGELARRGIHPPERTPFLVPWTDAAAEPGFLQSVRDYHLGELARWSREAWNLNLVAFVDGRVAGTQGLGGGGSREVHTGSWLGTGFQNRGLGTEMRAAVLELAFRGLGADAATSGAFADNPQSARVSEKLGYAQVGERTVSPRGEPVTERRYRLERGAWRRPVPVEIENLEPALPYFGPFSANEA